VNLHRRASEWQIYWRKRAWILEKEIGVGSMIFDEKRMTEDEKLEAKLGLVRNKEKDEQDKTSYEDRMGEGRSEEKHKKDVQQETSKGIRETLDQVFRAFIFIWICLSSLGVAILVLAVF
jgi:hypothetical protein